MANEFIQLIKTKFLESNLIPIILNPVPANKKPSIKIEINKINNSIFQNTPLKNLYCNN
jgi:hypothetical protein